MIKDCHCLPPLLVLAPLRHEDNDTKLLSSCLLIFLLSSLLWKTKDDTYCCRFLLMLLFLWNTKTMAMCHHLHVFFFLAFVAPVKDKRWQLSNRRHLYLLLLLLSDTKIIAKSYCFCVFFFMPSSFLWKIGNNNNDLWSSSSSPPPPSLNPLKHKDDNLCHHFRVFFCLNRSYERQKMMMICDHCHFFLFLFSLFSDMKTMTFVIIFVSFVHRLCYSYGRTKMTTTDRCYLHLLLLFSFFSNTKTTT